MGICLAGYQYETSRHFWFGWVTLSALGVSKISMLCFGSAVLGERSCLGIWSLAWAAPLCSPCGGEGAMSSWGQRQAWMVLLVPLALSGFAGRWKQPLEDKCSSQCQQLGWGGWGRCAGQLFLLISISFNARSPQAMLINGSSPSHLKHLWCWCLVIPF